MASSTVPTAPTPGAEQGEERAADGSRPWRKERVPLYVRDPVKYEGLGMAAAEEKKPGSAIGWCHLLFPMRTYDLGTDLARWKRHADQAAARSRADYERDLFFRDMWSYETLRPIFPRAATYRAGFVVLTCCPGLPETCKVLLVHERKPTVTYDHDGRRTVTPPKIGLPKGTAKPGDRSAWDTAIRELREEIGTDAYRASAANSSLVHRLPIVFPGKNYVETKRDETRETRTLAEKKKKKKARRAVLDVAVYFVTMCLYEPSIELDAEELAAYSWHDWSSDFERMHNLSAKTMHVLARLRSSCPDMPTTVAGAVKKLHERRAALSAPSAAPSAPE